MSLAVHVPFILSLLPPNSPPPKYSLRHDHLPNDIINNANDLNCNHSIFSRSLHCILPLPPPPFLSFPPHVVFSKSASIPHLSEATSGYSSRTKLSPPRLRQYVFSATSHRSHRSPILGSKRTCIPLEPAVAFNDLQFIRCVTRFLSAWTLAKSNRPILGNSNLSVCSFHFHSFLLLTDAIQPLKLPEGSFCHLIQCSPLRIRGLGPHSSTSRLYAAKYPTVS